MKSHFATSQEGCYMANTNRKTEIVPVTIQVNDIGNLIYTIRDKRLFRGFGALTEGAASGGIAGTAAGIQHDPDERFPYYLESSYDELWCHSGGCTGYCREGVDADLHGGNGTLHGHAAGDFI